MSVTCQKMNRRELLNYINEISFAVDDTKLFLDTHPWDQNVLLFFNECSRKRNEALRDYASAYGPLTIDTATAAVLSRNPAISLSVRKSSLYRRNLTVAAV